MTPNKRPYGIWTAVALVIGGMIGSGIFILPGQIAPYGWTGVLAWIVAGLGAILLAAVIGRLTRAVPEAEGMVALCAQALGPLPGVLIGWSYWAANCSTNAVYALAATRYLGVVWPKLTADPWHEISVALATLWVLTVLNWRGQRGVGLFQRVTTVLKLIPLLMVVALLGWLVAGGAPFPHIPKKPVDLYQLTPALSITFFALLGFEGLSVISGRVRDPARNIGRATSGGVALTGLLYLIVSTGIAFTLDPQHPPAAPVAEFLGHHIGYGATQIIALFTAVSIIGALNCWVLVNSELPAGMVTAGLLPKALGVRSNRDVPTRLLLLSSGTSTLMILGGLLQSTRGLLDFMTLVTTSSNLWLYLGACAAAWTLKLARPAAAVGLIFSAWVMLGTGWYPTLLGIALMATAIPLYYFGRSAKQPA